MKKTYNINLAGYAFVIDDDAYEMLDGYLSALTEICRRTGEPETAADIEQRIAEVFVERLNLSGRRIITRQDTETVISQIGSPEEIMGVSAEAGPSAPEAPTQPTPPPTGHYPIKKRLYRDLYNRVFGGVCSGLGWYLGIDPVWVRIAWVVLTLITGSTLAWIYVILWICIPGARTPYERMQMMGVDSSVSNVGKFVTEQYSVYPEQRGVSGMARGCLFAVLIVIAMMLAGAITWWLIMINRL